MSASLKRSAPAFILPGGDSRTVVIGATGTGKTTFAAWLLSEQRFDKRPWIVFDFKGEDLFYDVGSPPIKRIALGTMPGKKGLYIVQPRPDQEDEIENYLWKIWHHGNIGLFFDEVALVPSRAAFKAILRQGRSKLIPCISCTQRPVDIDREVFTEASYVSVFRMSDERDYKIVQGFTRKSAVQTILPPHWSYWYDVKRGLLFRLQPAPSPANIVASLQKRAPYSWLFGR